MLLAQLALQSGNAQTAGTGAISGTVTDSSGAVVPDAIVSVANIDTGETRSTASQRNGVYRAALLPPGSYRVEVSKTGYKTWSNPRVVVSVTETSLLNTQLQLGTILEKVTVEAVTEQLETTSAALGQVVPGAEVHNLPLVTRNYTQVINLSPGISAEVNNAADIGRGNGGMSGGITGVGVEVHGAPSYDNNFQMNGVPINDMFGAAGLSRGVAIPNPDTIQEFKVQTGQYDSSFGRNAGANVNVVTKGGGNNFHGTIFEFFRNEDLNANSYFNKLAHQPRGLLRQNQFGFTLGGPLVKDKVLFFVSYQGTRQTNGIGTGEQGCSSSILEPPLTDDRSRAALGALFAGRSGALGPAPGNIIAPDGSNISDQALAILNLKLPGGGFVIPTPQVIKSGQSFEISGFSAFANPCKFNEDQFMANVDFLQSDKSKFSARFFFANGDQTITFPATDLTGATSPGFPTKGPDTFRNFSLTHGYAFNANLYNEAEVGLHRITGNNIQSAPFTFSQVGVNATPFTNIPNIAVAGSFAAGGHGQTENFAQNHFRLQDSLSYVHGRHILRFGAGVSHGQENFPKFNLSGSLFFLSFEDFLLGTDGTTNGTGLSNIFLSLDLAGLFAREWRTWDTDAYAQDDIKVNSRLMLNLGVRYERLGGIGEKLGRNTSFDLAAADPNPPPAGSFQGFVVPSNFPGTSPPGVIRLDNDLGNRGDGQNTVGPRFGFAWRVPGTERLVLRGGYGLFYSRVIVQPTLQGFTSQPFALFQTPTATANATATFANPFPPEPASFPAFVPYSPSTALTPFVIAQNFRPSMVQQYSLNTQLQLAHNFLLQVGYVGTRGTHLVTTIEPNQARLASVANPIRGQTTNTLANIQQRVPVEGFLAGGFNQVTSEDSSWYNGLEVSLSKRVSKGLQFLGSYTFSRALAVDGANVTGTTGGSIAAIGDQTNPKARYGPSVFNRDQRLVVSYLYDFPSSHNLNSFVGMVLGGWELSGVTTVQTGQPLTITGQNAFNAFGITNDRAPLAPGCTNSQAATRGNVTSRLNNYFNTSCIGPAVPWTVIGDDGLATNFGNSGIGIIRGPDQRNFDIAVIKRTRTKWPNENANVELRGEFFNAFNTPQFANPDTSVSDPSFGIISNTAVSPRVIQLALKFNY